MQTIESLNSALDGRYVIEREIGRGGMATVFLARDARHERRVAIKFLEPELGAVLGADRFLSEIRVTANLQHPHLLPLFDSGEVNGQLFYVMPFVDGETLRARLDREKQFGVDEAVRIASEVADALGYAHGHGIIHRDLKPENILLQSGHALVADFGIALAVSNAGGQRVTQTGLSLGTPQYMSPEQATGDRVIDRRSDVYSLAALTYEMLAGEAPHTGNTVQAIVARVLTEKPRSLRIARSTIPEHVAYAVERGLEKLPADRFDTAREFADALRGRTTFTQTSASAFAQRPPSRLQQGIVIGSVAVALASLASAAMLWRRGPEHVPRPAHFTLSPQKDVHPTYPGTWGVTLTPDGSTVIYTALGGGTDHQLYARRLTDLEGRPIPGTARAVQHVVSPDGKWLAFLSDGKLRKVPIEGGAPVALMDARSQNGADWAGDEIILGSDAGHTGLVRVSANGGTPRPLTQVDSSKKETDHLWPVVLADGETVLFATWDGMSKASSRLAATSLKDGAVTRLEIPGIAPLGVIDDQLIYVRQDGTIMAVEFDVRRRRVVGNPITMGEPVPVCAACNGDAAVRLGRSGDLVTMRGSPTVRPLTVDRSGRELELAADERDFTTPSISPDGRYVALNTRSPSTDVWLLDIASRTTTRLTTQGSNIWPNWAPDSRSVLYASDREGSYSLYRQGTDGLSAATRLTDRSLVTYSGALSSDGKSLILMRFVDQKQRIDTMTIGASRPAAFVRGSTVSYSAAFSPDGRSLAYASDESGQNEVYVRGFPGAGGRIQLSTGGGGYARWSGDGKRIAYQSNGQIILATISTSPTFKVVSREPFFTAAYTPRMLDRGWDLTADASRIVMLKSAEAEEQVVVMVNWAQELRAKTAKGSK